MLIVRWPERPCDRPAFGVPDVFGHLVAERSLAERGEALPQCLDVGTGTEILGTKSVDVSEKMLIDQCGKAVKFEKGILERSRRQQQFSAILGRPSDALPDLVALPIGIPELMGFVDDDQVPGNGFQVLPDLVRVVEGHDEHRFFV